MVAMVTRPEELVAVRARLADAALRRDSPLSRRSGRWWSCPRRWTGSTSCVEVADFFSIGSNDLTATTLGLSRTDRRLTPALAADPRVLRQVQRVVEIAGAAGRARVGLR